MQKFGKILKQFYRAGILATAMIAGASTALAATQGTLGNPSTGTSDISVTIPELIRISAIDDFAFGTYGGAGALNATDEVCIFQNIGSGTILYTVTATTDTGAYQLDNAGATANIPFTLNWTDVATTAALAYNTPTNKSATFGGASCAGGGLGGTNSSYTVNILEADLQVATPDAYSATLTLVIAPQ